MLGIKREMESFSPVDIFAYESKHGMLEDSIRESIAHYNKAIDLVKMDSEDIAILELKRAINLNPHFNEAKNMLGLCLAYTGDSEKAIEIFKSVIQEENNSVKALDYIGKIDGLAAATELVFSGSDFKAKTNKTAKTKANRNPKNQKMGFWGNYTQSIKYHMIGYVLVFAIGCGTVLVFNDNEPLIPTKDTPDKIKIAELETSIKELSTKNKSLSDELSVLKDKQTQSQNIENEKAKKAEKLNEAESLVTNRSFEQAADLLLLLKDSGFTGDDKGRFDKLWNDAIPKAAQDLYNQGITFFNNQNYKDASVKLSKAVNYGYSWEQTPYALYNLGKSYAAINDTKNAIDTYTKIRQLYPNSDVEQWSIGRLAELGVK